ncbi:hypothetical protein TURU_007908 [Turdus rufiventris]|nr:hypothetical protein TURU_007908 [Turdus rufiventris]
MRWEMCSYLSGEDAPRFAFSVPTINREAPMKRYHWKGERELVSPMELTPEAKPAIKKIEGQRDSLLIIEWVFLSNQRSKTITKPQELIAQLIRKARMRRYELAGCDFTCIHLPVKLSEEGRNSPERLTKEIFEHLLQSNASLQLSLYSYSGQISVHALSHKLFNEEFHLIPHEESETIQGSRSVHGCIRGFPQVSDVLEKSSDSALGS